MKEQDQIPEKELNEMEARNLPDTEFKTLVIRMLKKLSENFNKDIVSIKKKKKGWRNHKKEPIGNEECNN